MIKVAENQELAAKGIEVPIELVLPVTPVLMAKLRMSTTTPIVDFVRRYAQSGTSRLHMPGHKGQSLLGFERGTLPK